MAVFGFGSVRSCGVTTTVVTLAAVWPEERRPVVVELDPAGGTLAASCGLRVTPVLVSFATASRRRMDPEALWVHSQALPGRGAVVVGPPSAGQAQRALKLLTDSDARFGDVDGDVLADCGRLDLTSAARPVFESADAQVICVRPQLPDLHRLGAWLEDASSRGVQPLVVLVGAGPYSADEVGSALGVEVAAQLPHDPAGVARVAEAPIARAHGRSALLRAARSLTATLVAHVTPRSESPLDEDAPEPPEAVVESDELVREEARS
jgi:hypothetical protein